jgi:hypothetical protein
MTLYLLPIILKYQKLSQQSRHLEAYPCIQTDSQAHATTMLRLSIIMLACFTLSYIYASPTDLANLAPAPALFGNAPGPFIETGLRERNPFRNRKYLLEALSEPSPMKAPVPTKAMDRNGVQILYPNSVQSELIKWFLRTRFGGAFTLTKDGQFLERHKKPCDPKYLCGKTEIFDEDGAMIKETGCCFSPHHSVERASWNCGECSIILGPIGSCLLLTAIVICLLNSL